MPDDILSCRDELSRKRIFLDCQRQGRVAPRGTHCKHMVESAVGVGKWIPKRDITCRLAERFDHKHHDGRELPRPLGFPVTVQIHATAKCWTEDIPTA